MLKELIFITLKIVGTFLRTHIKMDYYDDDYYQVCRRYDMILLGELGENGL